MRGLGGWVAALGPMCREGRVCDENPAAWLPLLYFTCCPASPRLPTNPTDPTDGCVLGTGDPLSTPFFAWKMLWWRKGRPRHIQQQGVGWCLKLTTRSLGNVIRYLQGDPSSWPTAPCMHAAPVLPASCLLPRLRLMY